MSTKHKATPHHTPTTWKAQGDLKRYIVSDDGVLVADLYADSAEDFGLPQTKEVTANARLIVTAVNNHAALLAALKAAFGNPGEWEEQALKAIAAAEKES